MIAAASLDGKISSAAREPVRFPSRADRIHLFARRDVSDAIVVGAGTIRAEDPPLLPSEDRRRRRVDAGLRADPLRVLVSRSLDLDPGARALRPRPGAPRLIWTAGPDDAARADRRRALLGVGAEVLSFGDDGLDLRAALRDLRRRGVRRALCEGGGELNAAFLAADLIEDIWLTLCPLVIAGRSAPTLADGSGGSMEASRAFKLEELRRAESGELFLHYRRKSGNSLASQDV